MYRTRGRSLAWGPERRRGPRRRRRHHHPRSLTARLRQRARGRQAAGAAAPRALARARALPLSPGTRRGARGDEGMAKTDPGIGFCTQATPRAHRPSRRALQTDTSRRTSHPPTEPVVVSPGSGSTPSVPTARAGTERPVARPGLTRAQRHAQGHRVAAHQGLVPFRGGAVPRLRCSPAPGTGRGCRASRGARSAIAPHRSRSALSAEAHRDAVLPGASGRSVRRTKTRFIRRVGRAPADSSALIDQATRGWPSKHCHSPCGSRPRYRRRVRRLPAGADPGAGRERSAPPERTRRSGRSPSARRAARHGGPRHDRAFASVPAAPLGIGTGTRGGPGEGNGAGEK